MAAFSLHHLATLAVPASIAARRILKHLIKGVRTSAPVWPKFANVS
jgi:hypothetical protein